MKVIFVVGTTASGKSDLTLALAQKFSGAVVNCDSIQVFKDLNIGSAKPSNDEFRRAPHFLFDFISAPENITAGEYTRYFFDCLEKIKTEHSVAFVVGGTGFYFQAVEKGMYSIGAANDAVKEQVEEEIQSEGGAERLYAELTAADLESAKKISINDHYRLGRAIEILRTHKRPLSEIKKEFEAEIPAFPYPLLKLGLAPSKEDLLPRVEMRTDQMLKKDLVGEVKVLLEKGLGEWAPLSSVGYDEVVRHLKKEAGFLSAGELRDKIIQNTMRLAKKQRTWFQRDKDIHWLNFGKSPRELEEQANSLVEKFLAFEKD